MENIKQAFEQKNTRLYLIEILIIFVCCIVVYLLSASFDILEIMVDFSKRHEHWELDEIITVSVFLMFAMIVFSIRRWQESKRSKALLFEKNIKLKNALEEIKQLEGIIPICSSCKKIRNDTGFWEQVEHYIETYSKAKFSHSMCSECSEKFYGNQDWYIKKKHKQN